MTQYIDEFTITDNVTSVVDLSGSFDINHLYLKNLKEFNCTNEIGLKETDFSFDGNVVTMTCREGVNIMARN